MLDTIFNAVKDELGLLHTTQIMLKLEDLVAALHADYLKDGNARDACLDALSDLILKHKTGQV